ncbi:hypothetical protein A2480_02800 [Candidatus Uhrbacteria bacterium RIFOXYC2_FULL_47_19]|uniref:Uncharacterized protein n=1 Tax=Candidatus Uhrbacteria bacterium RIFOXYC2_FULL_47_19 TaxID=1802424 RepID=A0A1F7WFV8_9BACT|nr:MAG: hypothetical protein A2480_02800 [Candidatus Uhrbacteria bacterium RIFOXYC2_FULL_47_19]
MKNQESGRIIDPRTGRPFNTDIPELIASPDDCCVPPELRLPPPVNNGMKVVRPKRVDLASSKEFEIGPSGLLMPVSEDEGVSLFKETDLPRQERTETELMSDEMEDTSYADLPPKIVAAALKAHEAMKINLLVGQSQLRPYVDAVLEASGFDGRGEVRSTFRRFLSGELTIEDLSERIDLRKKGAELEYGRLSLLLLPEAWSLMPDKSRLDMVRALAFLLDRIREPEKAHTGELALRLAQLSRSADGGLKREIWAALDLLPYDQLPRKAKADCAAAMADAGDFSSPLSISLLADRTHGAPSELERLRAVHGEAWLGLSTELSKPVADLAEYFPAEWSALVARVMRAGPPVPESSGVGLPHIGFELEYAPFSGNKEEIRNDVEAVLNGSSLLEVSIDQECIELRTGKGGMPLDLATLASLHMEARRAEVACPGWLASLHIHVDADALPPKVGKRVFAKSRDQTNDHGTTEVRSLPPPTLTVDDGRERRGRKHRIDPVRLGWLATFAARAAEVPEDVAPGSGNFDSLGPADAVRKALTLSLMGSSPEQRAAAVYAVYTSPLFVDYGLAVHAVRSWMSEGGMGDAYSGLLKIGYGKELGNITRAIVEYGGEVGLNLLMGRVRDSADANTKNIIAQAIVEYSGEVGTRLFIDRFDDVWDSADTNTKNIIARAIVGYGGEVDLNLLMGRVWDSADANTKNIIAWAIVEYGGEVGTRLFIDRFDEVWDSVDANTKNNIARAIVWHIGEVGIRLFIDRFDEIWDSADVDTKNIIAWAIVEYGGEDGLNLLMGQVWDSAAVDTKNKIALAIVEYGGEVGIRLFIDRFDDVWDLVDANTKNIIARAIVEYGGEVGTRLFIDRFDEVWDSVDANTKNDIARVVAEYGGEVGLNLLMGRAWDSIDADTKKDIVKIIRTLGSETGLEFLKEEGIS